MKDDTNIYTFYKEYTSDIVDCVYKSAPNIVKQSFIKKWGPYLRKKNKNNIYTRRRNFITG